MRAVAAGLGGTLAIALGVGAHSGCNAVLGVHEGTLAADASDEAANDAPAETANETAPDASSEAAAIGICGAFHYVSATCAVCMDAHCCDPLKACEGRPTCLAYTACELGCAPADAKCRANCDEIALGTGPINDVISCRAASCSTECAPECGGLVNWAADTCQRCLATSCCAQATACATERECTAIDECGSNGCIGGGPACLAACQDAHPAGVKPHQDLATCGSGACADACATGAKWSCVGHVSWPRPTNAAPITLDATYTDFNGAVLADLHVDACASTDVFCTSAVATGKTDAAGHGSITFPVGSAGFTGFFQVTGPKVAPTLLYADDPPIVESIIGRTAPLPTLDLLATLGSVTGIEQDPTLGAIYVIVFDCAGNRAPGISFTAKTSSPTDKATQFYFTAENYPSTDLTATTASATGGFSNLPAGQLTTVTATLVATGAVVATKRVMSRAGYLTSVLLYPTP